MSKLTNLQKTIIEKDIMLKINSIKDHFKLQIYNGCSKIVKELYPNIVKYLEKNPGEAIWILKNIFTKNYIEEVFSEYLKILSPLDIIYEIQDKFLQDIKNKNVTYVNELAFVKNIDYIAIKEQINEWFDNHIEPKAIWIKMIEQEFIKDFKEDPELAVVNFKDRLNNIDCNIIPLTTKEN